MITTHFEQSGDYDYINKLNALITQLNADLSALGVVLTGGNVSLDLGGGALTAGIMSASDTISSTKVGLVFSRTGATTSQVYQRITTTGGDVLLGIESSAGGGLVTGSAPYATVVASAGNTPVQIGVNGTLAGSFSATLLTLAGGLVAPGIYSTTTASAANAFVDTDGTLKRSTSAAKYKDILEDMSLDIALKLVDKFHAIYYKSLCPGDNPDWTWYGGVAEEVAAIDPRFVHWGYEETDYETVEIEGDEIDQQLTETVTEMQSVIEIRNGVPVQVFKPVEVRRPLVNHMPVVDELGFPVMRPVTTTDEAGNETTTQVPLLHPVPVMQKVRPKHTERRLKAAATLKPVGLQYERLTVPLMVVMQQLLAERATK